MVAYVLCHISALKEVLYHFHVQKEHTTIILGLLLALNVHLAIIALQILQHMKIHLAQLDSSVLRELLHLLNSHVHLVPIIIVLWLKVVCFVCPVRLVCTVKVMVILFQQDFVKKDGFVCRVLPPAHQIIA